MQIPNVSSTIANTIMTEYKGSLPDLLTNMKSNAKVLNHLMVKNKTGALRKINKNAIQNIYHFFKMVDPILPFANSATTTVPTTTTPSICPADDTI